MKKYETLTKMMRLINVPLSVMRERQLGKSQDSYVDEIIESGVKHIKRKNNWIPLTEKQPQHGQDIIILTQLEQEFRVIYIETSKDQFKLYGKPNDFIIGVTHWKDYAPSEE